VHSQVVTGTSPRNALLRAADVAVEKTNGLGLRGFFASRLAFVGSRGRTEEILVGDLFFGEVRQLTQDHAQMLSPRWSPDGSRLVYTSFYKSGFPDIFQIDLNTYQRTTLVSLKGTNSGARFSPNGQQVAMVLSGEGNPEIYVGNAQGRLLRRLTRTDAVEASPCFSPDGSRLVFTSDAVGGPQLYTMPVAGGTMTRLPTAISGYCAEPDWSRGNPNRIAFTMKIGRGYQIAVYDLATHQSQQVSRKRRSTAWSPRGSPTAATSSTPPAPRATAASAFWIPRRARARRCRRPAWAWWCRRACTIRDWNFDFRLAILDCGTAGTTPLGLWARVVCPG
jgi:TolB protein